MFLQVHVICLLVAYGIFGVAAGYSLFRLVLAYQSRLPLGKTDDNQGLVEGGWFFRCHQSIGELDAILERVLALGFPWLTMGILSGAIWANRAWGRYWGWDPKETWAFVVWLLYLLLLHLGTFRNWRGIRLASLTLFSYAIVLF